MKRQIFFVSVVTSLFVALRGQAQELPPMPASGYSYSQLTRMFDNRLAGGFQAQTGGAMNVYAWTSSEASATIHWSRSDQYQETFQKRGNWIVLSDWAALDSNGASLNYFVSTKLAYIIIRGQWIDITSQFAGGPHPYALENVPAEDYAMYIQAEAVEYRNGVKTENPNAFFQWYVSYGKPMVRPTLFLGNQIRIDQSEDWIDSHAEVRQWQTICLGYGLLCSKGSTDSAVPLGLVGIWFF